MYPQRMLLRTVLAHKLTVSLNSDSQPVETQAANSVRQNAAGAVETARAKQLRSLRRAQRNACDAAGNSHRNVPMHVIAHLLANRQLTDGDESNRFLLKLHFAEMG